MEVRKEPARNALYKTVRWRRLRLRQLKKHPLCKRCLDRALVVAASVVHHVKPHRGNEVLFFDAKNLQSSCKPCHDGPLQQIEVRGFSTEIGEDGWPVDPEHPANKRP